MNQTNIFFNNRLSIVSEYYLLFYPFNEHEMSFIAFEIKGGFIVTFIFKVEK